MVTELIFNANNIHKCFDKKKTKIARDIQVNIEIK